MLEASHELGGGGEECGGADTLNSSWVEGRGYSELVTFPFVCGLPSSICSGPPHQQGGGQLQSRLGPPVEGPLSLVRVVRSWRRQGENLVRFSVQRVLNVVLQTTCVSDQKLSGTFKGSINFLVCFYRSSPHTLLLHTSSRNMLGRS